MSVEINDRFVSSDSESIENSKRNLIYELNSFDKTS